MNNIEEITSQLETGVKELYESDNYKAYLDTMAKFHDYSVNNCILIWMQNPDATLVAGYQAWKNKFKRQVRKGEKAIRILAPCPHKYKKEVKDADGNIVEREFNWTSFRAVNVFNLSQTDGDKLPDICTALDGSIEDFDGTLKKLEKLSPVPVSFEDIKGGANGYFSHADKRIVVKAGMSEKMTVKTLVHEISHALLHAGDEKLDKRTKEVQAESVAYVVCKSLGIDSSEYSFGYVAGWSGGKEVKELISSMETIRKTARTIIDALRAA